jgi:hypothetical protein
MERSYKAMVIHRASCEYTPLRIIKELPSIPYNNLKFVSMVVPERSRGAVADYPHLFWIKKQLYCLKLDIFTVLYVKKNKNI